VTIAFGVACEDGVLLATDSMTQLHRPNGWIDVDLFSRKFLRLGDRFAMVASGCLPAGYAPDPALEDLSIDEVASAVLGELQLLEVPAEKSPGGFHRPTDLLIGRAHAPELLLTTTADTSGLQRAAIAAEPLVAGAMGRWAREAGVRFAIAPRRLEQAIPYALECCRQYIRESWRAWGFEHYEDFHAGEPGGHVPPSAPPYQLAVITTAGIETMEVPE